MGPYVEEEDKQLWYMVEDGKMEEDKAMDGWQKSSVFG